MNFKLVAFQDQYARKVGPKVASNKEIYVFKRVKLIIYVIKEYRLKSFDFDKKTDLELQRTQCN